MSTSARARALAHPRCLLFRVKSASAEHLRTLRLALRDLNAALGYRAFALSRRGKHLITFDTQAFANDPAQTIGHAVEDTSERWTVSIRPALKGAGLLATIIHEMGHVLGLDHVRCGISTRNHIMAIELRARKKPLTARSRQRWVVQVAHEAAKMRAREHFAQI